MERDRFDGGGLYDDRSALTIISECKSVSKWLWTVARYKIDSSQCSYL